MIFIKLHSFINQLCFVIIYTLFTHFIHYCFFSEKKIVKRMSYQGLETLFAVTKNDLKTPAGKELKQLKLNTY